jgi:hypothetical protein
LSVCFFQCTDFQLSVKVTVSQLCYYLHCLQTSSWVRSIIYSLFLRKPRAKTDTFASMKSTEVPDILHDGNWRRIRIRRSNFYWYQVQYWKEGFCAKFSIALQLDTWWTSAPKNMKFDRKKLKNTSTSTVLFASYAVHTHFGLWLKEKRNICRWQCCRSQRRDTMHSLVFEYVGYVYHWERSELLWPKHCSHTCCICLGFWRQCGSCATCPTSVLHATHHRQSSFVNTE